jgi:hypothetical protein
MCHTASGGSKRTETDSSYWLVSNAACWIDLHPHPQGKVLYEGAYGHRGTTHTLKDKSFAFDAAL